MAQSSSGGSYQQQEFFNVIQHRWLTATNSIIQQCRVSTFGQVRTVSNMIALCDISAMNLIRTQQTRCNSTYYDAVTLLDINAPLISFMRITWIHYQWFEQYWLRTTRELFYTERIALFKCVPSVMNPKSTFYKSIVRRSDRCEAQATKKF